MDNFQAENDDKLLALLQKSETSDKEIYSKVKLVKDYNEEIEGAVERVRNGESVSNEEVMAEIEELVHEGRVDNDELMED